MSDDSPSPSEQKTAVEAHHSTDGLLARENQAGRYVTIKELGRGAMGVIHTVKDQDLRRISAMKVISPQLIDTTQRFEAFIYEARLTADLEHPNIVPIHDLGVEKESGLPFYTMKLVDGEPLNEILDKIDDEIPGYVKKYDRHALLTIFRNVCHAVSYAHSKDVIHRDIKPENIMIGQFGEVLLMDWGLAKHSSAHEEKSADSTFYGKAVSLEGGGSRTLDGTIKGSPAYIAPEQAFGEVDEVDHKTDIFLLGSTLYHMLAHVPPYVGDDIMDVINRAETCDFPPPSEVNPNAHIPLALERIILKAMAPLKTSRYDSVHELILDVDAFITGKRVSGRKVFAVGQNLITAGEMTTECYVIYSGKVEIHRKLNGKKMTIATIGPGEIIGEMAGITGTPSVADATALESTDTLVITHELMKEELKKLPPWLEQIIFSMTYRLRLTASQTHPLLREQGAFPVIHQLYLLFLSAYDRTKTAGISNKISFNIKAVINEVSLCLGIDSPVIEKLISVLIESDLCKCSENDELSIADMVEFGQYVDYCRSKFAVKGGLSIEVDGSLSPEKFSHFRQTTRKLGKFVPK